MSKFLQWNNVEVEIINFNNDFLLLRSEDHSVISAFGKAIFESKFEFLDDVIVTQKEICLKLNCLFGPEKIDLLEKIEVKDIDEISKYRLPVYFEDHKDWKIVQSHTKKSREEIITSLLEMEFSIAMFGFLPGFIYMDGLLEELHVPRKSVPSKYTKENSLAIGGKYLGIYSLPSPGGWNVIGRLPISVLHLPQIPPVELNLSDVLSLEEISETDYKSLKSSALTLKEYNGKF